MTIETPGRFLVPAVLDALSSRNEPLSINLKVFLDGEEEVGSQHLAQIVREHADMIAADLLLFADGPRHQSGRPQVVLGVRGVQSAEITLFGPARALHSGHYGNWAVNPAARFAELLASLRAPDGRVRIAGFYDSVDQKLADRGFAEDKRLESELLKELRLSKREGADQPLARTAGTAVRNAIPTANLDFRLVPRQAPGEVRGQLENHLRTLGLLVVGTREQAEAAAERDRVALVQSDRAGYSGARFTEDAPSVRLDRPPVLMPLPSLLLSLPRTRGMRCSAEPASTSTRSRARRLDT